MLKMSDKLVQRIGKKALELEKLNQAVKLSLPVDCHDHITVADIRLNELVILTDSPVWQTRIRLYSQTILEALHQHSGVKLNRLKLKLAPTKRTIPEPSPVYRKLSHHNAQLIEQTANAISDPKLKAALLHLSQNK